MGPQLYRCGNEQKAASPDIADARFNGAATLSLRKYLVGIDLRYAAAWASIGPQLYRCGNVEITHPDKSQLTMLQWGCNFIVAEMPCLGWWGLVAAGWLQWGRNFIVAEMGNSPRCFYSNFPASMGPQLYRCGNTQTLVCSGVLSSCFNGAATLSLRKLSTSLTL